MPRYVIHNYNQGLGLRGILVLLLIDGITTHTGMFICNTGIPVGLLIKFFSGQEAIICVNTEANRDLTKTQNGLENGLANGLSQFL